MEGRTDTGRWAKGWGGIELKGEGGDKEAVGKGGRGRGCMEWGSRGGWRGEEER